MASPGKRSRDSPMADQTDLQDHTGRPHRRSRTDDAFEGHDETENIETTYTTYFGNIEKTPKFTSLTFSNTTQESRAALSNKQKKFAQLWYDDFVQHDVGSPLPNKCVVALATAIQARPQLVSEYIEQRRKSSDDTGGPSERQHQDRTLLRSASNSGPSSLTEENSHLPSSTLTLVEKYVSACHRRRSQNDGRRSVNTGPYRCTFGCGYRTKRAFDWRRHEETHEPQELWLCTICLQRDTINPFLVNRKDKFLKHAADKHTDFAAERVLEESKLRFVARAEWGCTYCGEESDSWDERCRHVLGHFEDEVEQSMKRVRVVPEEPEDDNEPSHGDSASVKSVESNCNNNEGRD